MDVVRLFVVLFFVVFAAAVARSGSDPDPRKRLWAIASSAMALLAGPLFGWAGIEMRGPLWILFGAILSGAGIAAVLSRCLESSRSFMVVALASIVGFFAIVVLPNSSHRRSSGSAEEFANWARRIEARGEPASTTLDFMVEPAAEDLPGIVDATVAGRPDASVTLVRRLDKYSFDRDAADWRRSASPSALVDFSADFSEDRDGQKSSTVGLENFGDVVFLKLDDREVADMSLFFAAFDATTSDGSGSPPPLRILAVDRPIDWPTTQNVSPESRPTEAESRPNEFLDGCRTRRIGVVVMPGTATIRSAFDGVVLYRVGPLEDGAILRLTIGRSDVKAKAIVVERPNGPIASRIERTTAAIASLIVRSGGNGPRFWAGFVFASAAAAALFESVTRRRASARSTDSRSHVEPNGVGES